MARSVRRFVKGRLEIELENCSRAGQRGLRYDDGCLPYISNYQCQCTILDGTKDPFCSNCGGSGLEKNKMRVHGQNKRITPRKQTIISI